MKSSGTITILILLLTNPQSNTAAEFARAQTLAATGRFEEAAAGYRRLTEAQPGNSRAWYGLGRAWVGAASAS